MRTSLENGAIKKAFKTRWEFQQTFLTPLKSLGPFVEAILSSLGNVNSGTVIIDSVAMNKPNLEVLVSKYQLLIDFSHDSAIIAESPDEVRELLTAALGDWVDFLFVPSPKPFMLYADHDEYTTFFAINKSNLNKVVTPLTERGYKEVKDYARNA